MDLFLDVILKNRIMETNRSGDYISEKGNKGGFCMRHSQKHTEFSWTGCSFPVKTLNLVVVVIEDNRLISELSA